MIAALSRETLKSPKAEVQALSDFKCPLVGCFFKISARFTKFWLSTIVASDKCKTGRKVWSTFQTFCPVSPESLLCNESDILCSFILFSRVLATGDSIEAPIGYHDSLCDVSQIFLQGRDDMINHCQVI